MEILRIQEAAKADFEFDLKNSTYGFDCLVGLRVQRNRYANAQMPRCAADLAPELASDDGNYSVEGLRIRIPEIAQSPACRQSDTAKMDLQCSAITLLKWRDCVGQGTFDGWLWD